MYVHVLNGIVRPEDVSLSREMSSFQNVHIHKSGTPHLTTHSFRMLSGPSLIHRSTIKPIQCIFKA